MVTKGWSQYLNRYNEYIVGILMAILILDVWVGVLDRYWFKWQLSWVEEMARYIMIWTILMAVPCAVARREHIKLELLTQYFPLGFCKILLYLTDIIMFFFFLYIAYAGINYTAKGLQQLSTVYTMPMAFPYAAIPVAFSLSALQVLLTALDELQQNNLTPTEA